MNKYEYQYELRKLLEFLYDAMTKRDELRIKELKDKMSDTHKNNLLDELNRSREVMENRIRELEDRSTEFTQSEQEKSESIGAG